MVRLDKLMIFKTILLFFIVTAVSSETTMPKLIVNQEAPFFFLSDLNNSGVALRDFCGITLRNPHKNKTKYIVIISFFATYCKPCRKEIPELQKFQEINKEIVKVLLISIDKDDAAVVRAFANELQINLTILLDKYQKVARSYGVSSLPSLFILDDRGILRYQSGGYREGIDLYKELTEIVSRIKQGEVVAKQEASPVSNSHIESAPFSEEKADLSAQAKLRIVKKILSGGDINVVAQEENLTTNEVNNIVNDARKVLLEHWERK